MESGTKGEKEAPAVVGFEHHSSFTKTNYLLARWRAKVVAKHAEGKVLDAGCGIGIVLDYLDPHIEYVGVDLNPNHVRYLSERWPQTKAYCMDIQKELPEDQGPYDTIISLAVIEHLEDPASFLQNCRRLLKPGGKLVITTPTRLGEKAREMLCRLRLVQRGEGGDTIHGHLNLFTSESISRLLRECGFIVAHARHFQCGMNILVVGMEGGVPRAEGVS